MPTWNQWYNPLDNVANISRGASRVISRKVGTVAPSMTSTGLRTTTQPVYRTTSNTAPSNPASQQNASGNTTQDPTNTATSTYRSSGTFDPQSLIEAQDAVDQANFALSRLGTQRENALANIASSFGNYRTSLQNDFNRNQGSYNTNRTQTITDQEKAKGRIDTQVRTRGNALQRLLGSAGAGDSQAALELAPYAAARTGTQLRAQVNDQYARNLSGLDQSWSQYNTDYTNEVSSLADQENTKRNQTLADFLTQEASAKDNLSRGQAAVRYAQSGDAAAARALRNAALPQIYQLLQQIDGLGKQPVTPTVNDISYDAPQLSDYTTSNMQDVAGIDGAMADNVDPVYQNWLRRLQDEDQTFFGH
jgi:hypothetical protein